MDLENGRKSCGRWLVAAAIATEELRSRRQFAPATGHRPHVEPSPASVRVV